MATKKNKVYEGATAPQDTSLFWVKTIASREQTFGVYRFKNGQWIQMSEDAAAIVMQIADDADVADVYTKEESDEKYSIAESMRSLFIAVGATYDETTGKYSVGGTATYTYAEMVAKFADDNGFVFSVDEYPIVDPVPDDEEEEAEEVPE